MQSQIDQMKGVLPRLEPESEEFDSNYRPLLTTLQEAQKKVSAPLEISDNCGSESVAEELAECRVRTRKMGGVRVMVDVTRP